MTSYTNNYRPVCAEETTEGRAIFIIIFPGRSGSPPVPV